MRPLALATTLLLGLPLRAQAQSSLQPVHLAAFARLVSECAPLGEPFSAFGGPSNTWPIPVELADSLPLVRFGAPVTSRNDTPMLRLDLSDFARIPRAETVRRWASDSSWAFTTCEMLAHEMAEALELQQLTHSGSDSTLTSDARF